MGMYIATDMDRKEIRGHFDCADSACSYTGWGMTDSRVFLIDPSHPEWIEIDRETGEPFDLSYKFKKEQQ